MKTIKDMLRDADPVRHEPPGGQEDRARVRQQVLAGASDAPVRSSAWFRTPVGLLAIVALMAVGFVEMRSKVWPGADATLHAAVRFEVRLAETQPAAGLREVTIAGSGDVIYLHDEVVVTNDDISHSRVIDGNDPSHFGVAVTFTAAGAEKMQRATAAHLGSPVAILIDGDVVAAPRIRAPIEGSAVITGNFTRAEAQRIADGMIVR